MNYTIIAHEEGRSGYDRCGDGYNEPGTFEVFHTEDGNAFAEKWAEFCMQEPSGGWDNFEILLDGKPYQYMEDDELELFGYYELEKYKDEEVQRLTKEAAARKIEAQAKAEREAAAAKMRAADAQRAADHAQYIALKSRLGL